MNLLDAIMESNVGTAISNTGYLINASHFLDEGIAVQHEIDFTNQEFKADCEKEGFSFYPLNCSADRRR